jgi:polyhydroxyalkanoate synthase
VEYVVGAAGHVAGIVNPPAAGKRSHWVGGERAGDAERWLATAESRPGSWWPHWSAWLAPKAGEKVTARAKPGNARHKQIEPAPGRYVRAR